VGYIAILALAITSHRGSPAHGTHRLASLHVTGMWIIAAVFTYSYFKRVPGNFWYAVPSALLFTAFVVRWIAKRAQARVEVRMRGRRCGRPDGWVRSLAKGKGSDPTSGQGARRSVIRVISEGTPMRAGKPAQRPAPLPTYSVIPSTS
jgi:hypothetical protein